MGFEWRKKVLLWGWNVFVIVALIVIACDRHSLKTPDLGLNAAGLADSKKLTLALFGAPSSADSQNLLPALQIELDKLALNDRSSLDQVLYVTTSGNPNTPPTEELAEQYRLALGMRGKAEADAHWKTFKSLVGGSLSLPAAALVDLDGTVFKIFRAGPTTFVPTEITTASQKALHRFKATTLVLFGAPWCSECKTELPAIQNALDKAMDHLTPTQRAYIDVRMYVTTSGNPS